MAARLQASGREWLVREAMRIYRRVGDHEKYLQLRHQHLHSGSDWYDLVSFHWEREERAKAVEVAQQRLQRAEGGGCGSSWLSGRLRPVTGPATLSFSSS